jgi:hypothetical protein
VRRSARNADTQVDVAAVAAFEICEARECPVVGGGWYQALGFANAESDAEGLSSCYVLEGCVGELGQDMTCSSVGTTTPEVHDCEGYRLPTEAEWEYATRAGTTTAFYSGAITARAQTSTSGPDPNLEQIGWYCHNSAGRPHPVGGKEPNAFGPYDVAGNAEECVSDRYTAEGYGAGPLSDSGATLDPKGPRVTRGDALFLGSEAATSSRRTSTGPRARHRQGLAPRPHPRSVTPSSLRALQDGEIVCSGFRVARADFDLGRVGSCWAPSHATTATNPDTYLTTPASSTPSLDPLVSRALKATPRMLACAEREAGRAARFEDA